MWLLSKEGALEKRRTSKLYAMEKEITVSEEWYKGLMGALDAQEASVLRVLWGTMLLLMAFCLCSLVFTFQMVHANFGGMGTRLREVHLCNKGNTNLQNTNYFEEKLQTFAVY